MNRALLILLLLIKTFTSYSQIFSGVVRSESGEPLEGATVVATSDGNKTVAFSITDENGKYQLNIEAEKEIVSVTVSFMGYQKRTFPFTDFGKETEIILTESSYSIKEVKVKYQRLKNSGDTLTYSVAGFKQSQDRSIAEVIAKMPGLEVKANGKIEYQGVPINKFYIEGLDLMGSQYGLANQNLSASKVQSVQVLENHQSIKSLVGVSFSDQAALNIVLKDEAKAVWTGTADVGLGYGDKVLLDNRLMGMCFDRKFQTLSMYKGNNIGQHLDNEVLDLTDNQRRRNGTESGILSMLNLEVPDLKADRYTFNNSHLVAGNWLWKVGENSELRVQGNGFVDKTDINNTRSSTYLTLADLPVIIEEQIIGNTRNEWKGEANYQYNGSKIYVKNNVRGYFDFNESIGEISYNGQMTDLMVKPHKRSLSEDFQLSHTLSNKNVYSIDSYWAYNYLPGQLLTINGETEQLDLKFLTAHNAVKYNIRLGKHYLNNEAGLDYDYQDIGVAFDRNEQESSAYQLICAFWTPSVSFVLGDHRLEVLSKVRLARQSYKLSRSKHLWLDPSLSWRWKASVVSDFSLSVKYANNPMMGKAIYDTPIFIGYRTKKENRGKTGVQHSLSVSAGYKYSNPVKGIFLNVRPTYILTTGNVLYHSSLQDNIYTTKATDKNSEMQTIGLSARLSKSISWSKALFGFSGSNLLSDYSLLVSDHIDNSRMRSTYVGFDYSMRPLRVISIEGNSSVSIYEHQNISRDTKSATTNWEHFLNLHVLPSDRWMISMKNELHCSDIEDVGLDYFLDFYLSYKSKSWELSFKANNVIGTSLFERKTLGNTIESYSVTRLRPRELIVKLSFSL